MIDLRLRHPELPAAALVGAAWLALLIRQEPGEHAMHTRQVVSALPWWTVMTIAMMGPAALAGVRHTGINSLWWRRGRAMCEFAAAYLAVWTIVGAATLGAALLVPHERRWIATAIALAAAAGWQLMPAKAWCLRRCHRSIPLPPRGWRAEAGALRFGGYHGAICAGSCWCLMLVMAIVPAAHLMWMAVLTLVTTAERLLERPRRATRITAALLTTAALVVFASTFFANLRS